MSNKLPVIIAAYNEEARIGRTLSHLDTDTYAPIVVVNGSTDRTAEVADEFNGVTVIERDEQGKLPAIQSALHHLGDAALGNVLYLDADSYPVSRNWGASMTAQLTSDERPSVVGGLTAFTDGNIVEDTLRSYRRKGEAQQAQIEGSLVAFTGSNMATHFGNAAMLGEILALPHIWPGEDRAIADHITKSGGTLSYALQPDAVAKVSSRFYPSIVTRIFKGRDAAIEQRVSHYHDRAAPTAEYEFGGGEITPLDPK